MTLSLASEAFANLPERAPSEISQVHLKRVEDPFNGDSEELALDELPMAARELPEPPLDFSEFIGQRWSLNAEAAQSLLCDWLRDYQPQRDYSAALRASGE